MSLENNQKSQGESSGLSGGWGTVFMPILVKESVTRMELWTGVLCRWKCPDPIWRVMDSSNGISTWTPLKPQHSNLTIRPINSGVLTSLLLPQLSSSLTDSLPSLNLLCHEKNWCSIHVRCSKISLKHSIRFCGFFPSLKQNFMAYRSSKFLDSNFEVHQLWQSGFSRVYSNCCCSCSFEPEIIKIGQLSHKMYSNNILNYQVSTPILNTHTKKKVWKFIVCTSYVWFCIK